MVAMADNALSLRSVAQKRGLENSSMDELPEELVANIGSRLSFDSLGRLSRTSKRYQRIANSVLYYDAAAEELLEHEMYCEGNLKAFVKYPWLTHHLRDLTLDFSYLYHSMGFEDKDEDEASWNIKSMTVLRNAVNVKTLRIQDDGDYTKHRSESVQM